MLRSTTDARNIRDRAADLIPTIYYNHRGSAKEASTVSG